MLFRLVLKNLVQRPLRYALTSVAIIFSVAAVSAVFIFTGGLRTTFGELAENIESGYDIAVQPRVPFGNDGFLTIDVDNADRIAPIDGVLAVQPRVRVPNVFPQDGAGEITFAPAGPNLGVVWGDQGPNTSLFLQEGSRPTEPDQFAIDIDGFESGDYEIGERYQLRTPSGSGNDDTFELTGTFTFANPDRNALVGALIVAFELDTAVELLTDGRGYTDITVILEEGADIDTVMAAIEEVVDDEITVRSQADVLAETQQQFGEILDIFQTVLLVFAIIILFVSAFLIYNVFSITLGQRIRELGLLRAVGAMGSQITRLMIGEALALGIFSTIIGIPAGVGLAYLLRAALIALGFPDNTGLPLSAPTIVWAVFTGVGITVLSAVWPSIQARRVSPLSAMRDGANQSELLAIENRAMGGALVLVSAVLLPTAFLLSGWAPRLFLPILSAGFAYAGVLLIHRRWSSLVLFPFGVALLLISLFGSFELGETFGLVGAGALVALLGANLLNPLLSRPVTSLAGRTPTMIVIGLIGAGFGAAGVGSIAAAVVIMIGGVPDSVIDATGSSFSPIMLAVPLFIFGVFVLVTSYGTLRTALGARGLAGQIARANAGRNPQRTATTAAALMIGLTLVTAVTIIGDSIKSSVTEALDSSVTADWLIQGPQGGPGSSFPALAGERIAALDEVESVVPFRSSFAAWATSETGELSAADFITFLPVVLELLEGEGDLTPQELFALQDELGTDIEVNSATAVDFAVLDDHIDGEFIERDETLAALPNAIYLVDTVAEDKGLEIGDTFSVLFIDQQSEDLVVAGIYANGFILGERVVTLELWERHFPENADNFLTAVTASGVPLADARAAIEAELADDFPTVEVQDRAEFAEAAELQLNQTLATVNVLLGLSAVIAALGILVALALSVFERTREIGLFRAVGSSRAQTRWIIRWEGVIIAIFGGVIGVALGVGLGVLVTAKLPEVLVTTISIPLPTLAIYLVFAALTGLAAAVFPAWVAGRMNILEAISTE